MGREKKKAKKLAGRANWPRSHLYRQFGKMVISDSDHAVLGLNLYCAIVDDAGFISGQHRWRAYGAYCDYEETEMSHNNGMLAIAQAAATYREVMEALQPRVDASLRESKRMARDPREARKKIREVCEQFFTGSYFHVPRQKITIDRMAKKALKGYREWWTQVVDEAERMEARDAKNGEFGYGYRKDAVKKLNPELFEAWEL